ncbi:hypothetical protein U1839_05975 [Sphingomonas sp. RT2P30]|uniref:hypothetical protein n=1 Tax=Parasphingomonas halimpatiens TaxID=3096162 RepID=UPI002FCC4948
MQTFRTNSPGTPSRRSILGAIALAPVIAAPAAAHVSRAQTHAEKFLDAMEVLHPNGRLAAQRAIDAGMSPSSFSTGIFFFAKDVPPDYVPALIFKTEGGYRSFRPRGEDN